MWSAITFIEGTSDSFGMFAGLRVLFGIVSSLCYPNAIGLLRDYFPPKYRSTANAVFGSSVYLGACVASFSVLLIENYGWREAYEVTGAVGMTLGALCLTLLREPQRGRHDLKADEMAADTEEDERSDFR